MRAVLVCLLIVSCGHHEAARGVDAAADTQVGPYCQPEPAGFPPGCATTCGNGVIDDCTTRHTDGEACTMYTHGPEACDGSAVPMSCTDVGYYGGSAACSSQCLFDASSCEACAASCVTSVGQALPAVVSGTQVGVARDVNGSYTFDIFDSALAHAGSAAIPTPISMTGVSDGWLLVTNMGVKHVDVAGTVTAGDAFDQSALAVGAGNRVLLLWSEDVMPQMPRIWVEVRDNAGTVVVPAFVLFDASTNPEVATATTDGTSFFVAAKGRLVKVAADGTVSPVVTGYPTEGSGLAGSQVQVSWAGSTGWYIVANDANERSYTAQRFDASAAMVGAPLAITSTLRLDGLTAYGTGLVGASIDDSNQALWRFAAVRLDGSGAQVASTELGVGLGFPVPRPFGSGVVTGWSDTTDRTHLALVTP